ncbi:putative signal transduction protein with Nacht domain protein [Gloeothece citriformis PCC 7424]|uniref:Putative signal transduction protein with Nacht domain protein n=1 Tax=Gloeothece citriformis (strain PCC 7424) TaxID=65393 RepID=B7KD03_GLOC7|nr:GUN4 domain-containing protein [Gloeothece citriformis]ACK73124.1 putative signal transduction protein with Nacht domain protein [Gloeothece citriformis PCC 7424]
MTEDKEAKQDSQLSEKITDALIKLLVTGSGGSSVIFLFKDDIPKALIAGGIAAGASLLTNFWEGLIGKLNPRTKAAGEGAADVVLNTINQVNHRFTDFPQLYREALKTHCYKLEVEGIQDLSGVALKDIFVPLRIISAQTSSLQQGINQICDFLPSREGEYSHHRIVILAGPGFGKTTLMRHLVYVYTTNPPKTTPQFLPVFLRFRDIYSLITKINATDEPSESPNYIDLPNLIITYLKKLPEFTELKPSQEWFKNQLKEGKCLVIFDGLDEVPKAQQEKVRQWTDRIMRQYHNTQFILTSRPHGFEIKPDSPIHPIETDLKLQILEFTNDQKVEFINNWYRTISWDNWQKLYDKSLQNTQSEQLNLEIIKIKIDQEAKENTDNLTRQLFANNTLNDLARYPLLITMITATHRADMTLPKQREELYAKIIDLLLSNRPYVKKTFLTLNLRENQVILQVLAWNLMQQEDTTFTPQQGTQWIEPTLKEFCKEKPFPCQEFWREMLEITGLVQERESELYEFIHQTFQEYFTALHLKEMGEAGKQEIINKLNNRRWEEVICFYAAVTDATLIIEAILDNPNYSNNPETLILANRCKNEGRRLNSTVRERLNQVLQEKQDIFVALRSVRLEQRFENLTFIDEKTAISEPISWGEYQLFLEAQTSGQFHSTAEVINILPEQENQPVTGINWKDARWFCCWLATQVNLQSPGKVYDYRLPTSLENENRVRKGITENPQDVGDFLRVVRVEIPNRYEALLNYLANGRWKEADEETYRLMIQTVGKQAGQFFDPEDFDTFPCEDLRTINQLWLDHSNGKFGFSVQAEIYRSLGGTREYNKGILEDFGDRVGWRKGGQWLDYHQLTYELHTTPVAHLPVIGNYSWYLFSRVKTCNL